YNQKLVLLVFLVTVILWLTSKIHGISSSVVALVPIILLYVLKLLDTEDFSKARWASLVLFGGGLSLGMAIHRTGLDLIMAEALEKVVSGFPLFIIFISIAAFGIILTAFLSNTAAAALMIPIMMPLSVSLGLDIRVLAILAALGVSFDLILPIGTPPGTMAYSTGYIKVWDMIKSGLILSAIGLVILAFFAFIYWSG
ncbi:MAG: anion permease, partial [Nanoarchaeota archaeon]|nr:anion permease [Nanoarchaeota archaeon]